MTDRPAFEGTVSAREAQVLAAVSEHLTNAEIAEQLFISVRTVESHVSSLLRKLRVADRRGLAAAAAVVLEPDGSPLPRRRPPSTLPAPLTTFVGREHEVADLTQALHVNRLVTVVGPGGIGKTRLAIRVAHDLEERFADGVVFVDLVTAADSAQVSTAVATALGLGESQQRSVVEVLVGWLATRRVLLVFDNCEHVLDAATVLLEQVLSACPGVAVLATSRSRLMLPFESVYAVPALSTTSASDGRVADAVELFVTRAAAGGFAVPAAELDRVAALCRGLDGIALAIELAAARVPALGLDGLEAGLADRLHLLAGGSRVDDRHRSLRSALDWSYALLTVAERAVLRRLSVVAGSLSAPAVEEMLGDWPPVLPGEVPALLARLADESLVVPRATPLGTRYAVLETIRQYGAGLLEHAGETDTARTRHLRWCLSAAEGLADSTVVDPDSEVWRARFDEVSIETRRCLPWAWKRVEVRDDAYRLSLVMAVLSFRRGRPGEAHRRFELAAELAPDDEARTSALRQAAGAAEGRQFGNEALRLRELAAQAALAAGDRSGAARDLARAAELVGRGPGIMAAPPAPGEVERLLSLARPLAGGDAAAGARILTAQGFARDPRDPEVRLLAAQAANRARQAGDPLGESAALDLLTAAQLAGGQQPAALDSALRRVELLAHVPITADSAFEFFDAYQMGAQCALAAGDLGEARRLAEGLMDLPFYREESHLATSRLIVVGLLEGTWGEALVQAEQFRAGWERAGQPQQGNLGPAPYAAATVHALRGDDTARAEWMTITATLQAPARLAPVPGRLGRDPRAPFGRFFDALVLLHRGLAVEAVELLADPPESLAGDAGGMWRAWYASTWVEAAVIAAVPDVRERLRVAVSATAGNPIARVVVRRADGLARGAAGPGRDELVAAASTLRSLGARYQWARTLVMLGADDRERGLAELATMGAAPMAWPPR